MKCLRLSRLFVPLVLILSLTVGVAEASPPPKEVSLFPNWLTWLWDEIGCRLDPSGHCSVESRLLLGDIGCMIDPNGLCAAVQVPETVTGDSACQIDPHGNCAK
jgi:hypothetical protein